MMRMSSLLTVYPKQAIKVKRIPFNFNIFNNELIQKTSIIDFEQIITNWVINNIRRSLSE